MTVEGLGGLPPLTDNRTHTDRSIRLWWGAAIASLFLSLIAIVLLEVQEQHELQAAISETTSDLTKLRSELIDLSSASEERSAAMADLDAATRAFQSSAYVLPVLARISETLNDDTRVPEYKQSQNQISITLFSSQEVPKVIAALQDIPEVETVQLSSPVMFDRQSAQSRFSLTLELVQK